MAHRNRKRVSPSVGNPVGKPCHGPQGNTFQSVKRMKSEPGERPVIEGLAAKPSDQSSIPGTYMEGVNQLLQIIL